MDTVALAPSSAPAGRRISRCRWSWTLASSLVLTLVTAIFLFSMVGLLVWDSLPAWRHEGFGFVAGTHWFYRQAQFGALPMIYGTLAVSAIALLLSAPVGIGAAIFVAEVIPPGWRPPFKITIELLAGVPSVVYGLLGILFLRNWIYAALEPLEPLSGDTILTAGILLAIMILPTITTLSEDALRGVPSAQRAAARGLGLTRAETILAVSLPQAHRGVIAALLLALGRALGETIAVFLVVGRQDNVLPSSLFSLRPLIEAGQTLTSKLGGSEVNIAHGDPLHWAAITGLGLMLLGLASSLTWAGIALIRKGDDNAPIR